MVNSGKQYQCSQFTCIGAYGLLVGWLMNHLFTTRESVNVKRNLDKAKCNMSI